MHCIAVQRSALAYVECRTLDGDAWRPGSEESISRASSIIRQDRRTPWFAASPRSTRANWFPPSPASTSMGPCRSSPRRPYPPSGAPGRRPRGIAFRAETSFFHGDGPNRRTAAHLKPGEVLMFVKRFADAKPYEAPNHRGVVGFACGVLRPGARPTNGSATRNSCPAGEPGRTRRPSRRSTLWSKAE
jgi:hypothetical protein